MKENRWNLGSGASPPHPTQTESPSWRRMRGEETEEDKGISQERWRPGWGLKENQSQSTRSKKKKSGEANKTERSRHSCVCTNSLKLVWQDSTTADDEGRLPGSRRPETRAPLAVGSAGVGREGWQPCVASSPPRRHEQTGGSFCSPSWIYLCSAVPLITSVLLGKNW